MLVSWLGTADLKAPEAEDRTDIGAVASTIEARAFDRVLLLADQNPKAVRKYESCLRARWARNGLDLATARVELTSPTNFEEIYSAVTQVGDDRTLQLDVRIVAATNRELVSEVAAGRFREDLCYRLAVLVLRAPPLREREGDLKPLIDGLLARINAQSAKEPGYTPRRISPAPWPPRMETRRARPSCWAFRAIRR